METTRKKTHLRPNFHAHWGDRAGKQTDRL